VPALSIVFGLQRKARDNDRAYCSRLSSPEAKLKDLDREEEYHTICDRAEEPALNSG
jgi:hypothetical protein